MLKNNRILLGITGGIAAYKSLDLTRRLIDEGASVKVVMTDAATRFVTQLSFETLSRGKVFTGLFDDPLCHIELPRDADVMLVAPATANSIGKLACGIGDDLLSTCALAFRGPMIVAPAMNGRMYENPAVVENLLRLKTRGVIQVGPEKGSLACGEESTGRMAEVHDILEAVRSAVSKKDLSGRRIVVTAGPTREYIDPVRFISNRSSGKMGYALARAALRRGAEVMLITGPANLAQPRGMKVVSCETASEMRTAVQGVAGKCDVIIMAAAVADFSPAQKSERKLDKGNIKSIGILPTPDILAELGSLSERPVLVGFSAETGPDIDRAARKRTAKGADIMVFNDVSAPGSGFDTDTNSITIIGPREVAALPLMTKDEAAEAILDAVSQFLP